MLFNTEKLIFLVLLDFLLLADKSKNEILDFDIKLIKIKTESKNNQKTDTENIDKNIVNKNYSKSKIEKINNYKYKVTIKVANDQIKINRDFPLQIKMSKTEKTKEDSFDTNNKNSNFKSKNDNLDLNSKICNKKYTRNSIKKLSDEQIVIEDEFLFYNEKNELLLKLNGSIGVCGDDFCRKIDIDKTFRFSKKPWKGVYYDGKNILND